MPLLARKMPHGTFSNILCCVRAADNLEIVRRRESWCAALACWHLPWWLPRDRQAHSSRWVRWTGGLRQTAVTRRKRQAAAGRSADPCTH